MRKKMLSVAAAAALLFQIIIPISYAASGISADISMDNPGEITVTGNTGAKGEAVTVAVFNPGKSIDDAKSVSSGNYNDVFLYTNVTLTDTSGKFTVTAKGDFENHKTYSLYIKNAEGNEYLKDFEYYNDDERVTYISYGENSVTVEGVKARPAHIVVLNPGYSADDYENNTAGAVFYDETIDVQDGEYSAEISGIDFSKGDFSLYADGESYILREPVNFYISKSGSNANDGSIEKPFLSITGARDYLRKNPQNAPVNVIIKDGEYLLTSRASFTEQDSGTLESPIVYKAENGGNVVLSGAKKLDSSDFIPVTDENILSRMYPEIAGKVYQLDLSKYYIPKTLYDFAAAFDDESEAGMEATPLSFYLNGNKQSIARYPNKGYNTFGDSVVTSGGERDGNGLKDAGIFKTADAARWTGAEDMFIEGFFRYTWYKEWAKVDFVNSSDNSVNLKSWTMYGLYPEGRWAAVNLLEEIDIPGEWFVDKDTAMLYYYPPHELTEEDDFELAALCGDLINIEGASNIRFEGITFTKNAYSNTKNAKAYYYLNNQDYYSDGITVGSGSSNIKISDCTFEDIAGRGVAVVDNTASYVTIDRCVFRDCETGFRMDGGDSVSFKKNYNVLKNSDLSSLYNGIHLNGFGNVVKNNVIHNVSQNGIVYTGNENMIKYNEMYNVSNKYADGGAVYAGRSWAKYANEINMNLFHDIGPFEPVGKEVWIVYWDDMLGGSVMKNNIVVGNNRSDVIGVQVAQGPDNVIEANTFVNFSESRAVDMSYRAATGTNPNIAQCRNSINGYTPGQVRRWGLERLMAIDVDNVATWASYKENLLIKNNVYSNCANLYEDNPNGYTAQTWKNIRPEVKADASLENNMQADLSVYVDPQNYDYRIKNEYAEDYPAGILTESNFSMDLIGIQSKAFANSKDAEFDLLYPAQREAGIDEDNVTLIWEKSDFSDYYIYEIAKDSGFTDIVAEGRSIDTVVETSVPSDNTVYYWRVTAVNNSRQAPYTNISETGVFMTYDVDPQPVFGTPVFEKDGVIVNIEDALENDIITVKDSVSGGSEEGYDISYALAFYNNERLVFVKTAGVSVTPSQTAQNIMEFAMPGVEFNKVSLIRLKGFDTMIPYEKNYVYVVK